MSRTRGIGVIDLIPRTAVGLPTEEAYAFRKRLDAVHKRARRLRSLQPAANEVCIGDRWNVGVCTGCSAVLLHAARDFRDYLCDCMGLSVRLIRRPAARLAQEKACVVLCEKSEMPPFGAGLKTARGYRITATAERIVVCGCDDRGAAQGAYFLEDRMNLREAPFVAHGETVRAPLFSPRMVHSGWGFNQFPDSHLSAIAHAGMDAIVLTVKGVDLVSGGRLAINDLVRRARLHGLDVYFYSLATCWKHPGDDDAEAHFDRTFGALFQACPQAKGIVLVGESCEFPSHDERTTRQPWDAKPGDGLPPVKPSPGWWPCRDYPQWVNLVKKVVRRWSPQADIVFWTYNWGYAPRKERLALIASLPRDISLLVTFEMFEPVRHEDAVNPVMDYTLSFAGPGRYFVSEAEAARKRGIRLYAMSNTGGCTWDFGVTPYEPFPHQWGQRHDALLRARGKWGLAGLMESHHYGFYPSFIAELAKWSFWSASPSRDEALRQIAVRDFGAAGAPHALRAWEHWSEAIRHYVPTNEDQYGPNRIGPSYPLIFHPHITRTFTSQELDVHAFVKTLYHPFENAQQSPGPLRIDAEIRSYRHMRRLLGRGLAEMGRAIRLAPAAKREAGQRQALLVQFMANTVTTTLHVKEWWKLNQRLFVARDRRTLHRLLDALVKVARAEMVNARATIPLVQRDSRLGWEPIMTYMCDKARLEWKLRQVQRVLEDEIPCYRKTVDL